MARVSEVLDNHRGKVTGVSLSYTDRYRAVFEPYTRGPYVHLSDATTDKSLSMPLGVFTKITRESDELIQQAYRIEVSSLF